VQRNIQTIEKQLWPAQERLEAILFSLDNDDVEDVSPPQSQPQTQPYRDGDGGSAPQMEIREEIDEEGRTICMYIWSFFFLFITSQVCLRVPFLLSFCFPSFLPHHSSDCPLRDSSLFFPLGACPTDIDTTFPQPVAHHRQARKRWRCCRR
jgi:hypothetical protein